MIPRVISCPQFLFPRPSTGQSSTCFFPRGKAFSSFAFTTANSAPLRSARRRQIHGSAALLQPRKRDFFSTNAVLREQQQQPQPQLGPQNHVEDTQKRKPARSPPGKSSLRRVAVEAQRSRDGVSSSKDRGSEAQTDAKTVTAYCAAERFDLSKVVSILTFSDHAIDPCNTGLSSQVVHIQIPLSAQTPRPTFTSSLQPRSAEYGDVFVFSSGTVVVWSLPSSLALPFVTRTLLPAAENPHMTALETEDLEYVEDPSRENSSIKGDTITIGTRPSSVAQDASEDLNTSTDTTLAKIAFSSGLSRSTKLAVLETLLSEYFESTRSIPTLLSRGSRLPFTRSFILRKTGQLLSVRAQLNLYSELTDSLPDLFWDSRHDLGLEGYYDEVGRALDVGVRIKVLNEKMDYAQEIASVLRERLSERHGLVLEWMIIALIAVEVGFEVNRLFRERAERKEREQKAKEHKQQRVA